MQKIGTFSLGILSSLAAFALAAAQVRADVPTIGECQALVTSVQIALNGGGDCDGITFLTSNNVDRTCASLNSKLDTAHDKLGATKRGVPAPKTSDANQALFDFEDALATKAAQGKLADGAVTLQSLIDGAERAVDCICALDPGAGGC